MNTPRPPWLLVAAVLVVHLLLGRQVPRIHEGQPPMLPRMQVEFVREMALQAAPVVAVRPVSPAPSIRPAVPPAAAAPAASEPALAPEVVEAAAPAPAASSPATAVPLAEPGNEPGNEPGAEWPLSTRLSYGLTGHVRGPVHGQAQVEWMRKGRDYQVHLDVGVGPSFAPLVTRRMSSHGRLTPEGIAPQRFDEETRVLLTSPRRVSLWFGDADVQLANGQRQPVARGAQDAASQFVQLTWLFLTGRVPLHAGRVVQFPLVLPDRQYLWPYEVLGEELLSTPMGPVAAWRLKPQRAPSSGDLSAEVWLAPALQYLPVRIIIRQDAENFVDLVLKSPPLQAASESPQDTRRPSP